MGKGGGGKRVRERDRDVPQNEPFTFAGGSHLQRLVIESQMAPATHWDELLHTWFTAYSETSAPVLRITTNQEQSDPRC